MIKVKVCGMRDPLNTQAVAGADPDYMGFIFHPGSKRFVGTSPDPVLFRMVPRHIGKVGVFVDEDPRQILNLAARLNLGVAQLHGNESVTCCRKIRSAGIMVMKAFGIAPGFDFTALMPYLPVCDYFLFDTKTSHHGGSGLQFNWDLLLQYGFDKPFFLSGGVGPGDEDAIAALKHPALWGVDINSCFENEPGIKDVDRVKTFITKIKTITA